MSSLNAFVSEIKTLIAQGEYDVAIEQLVTYLSGTSAELHNEVLSYSAQYNQLRKNIRRGLISTDAATTQQNKLQYSLLDFLDVIPTAINRNQQPIQSTSESLEQISIPDVVNFEKIIGVNNLKQISWVQHGIEVSKSVCRILTPYGLGTGFLIGGGLVMTNNHVIPNDTIAAESYVEFNYQQEYGGKHAQSFRYRLNPSQFKTNPSSELDYTIVGIVSEAGLPSLDKWEFLSINASAMPLAGELVVIIQHPNGGLKQIAMTANQVIGNLDYRLHYTTDTMQGSSGSPVFNDLWQVVAIHHAGGELQVNKEGQKRFTNEGILMSAIQNDAGSMWPQ